MQEAFVILFRKVRGNTLATGKERSLCCQLGSGALLKDSRSNLLHHIENWDEQNPKLNSLRDTALSFQKTSGHLITKARSSQDIAIWSSKKTFLEARESHSLSFQSKRYLWPCGVESRPPEPGASTCQDLQHIAFNRAHQRVQPDISVQRSLLSTPMMYRHKARRVPVLGGQYPAFLRELTEISKSYGMAGSLAGFPSWECYLDRWGSTFPDAWKGFYNEQHIAPQTLWQHLPEKQNATNMSAQKSHRGVIHFGKVFKGSGKSPNTKSAKEGGYQVQRMWHHWGPISPAHGLDAFKLGAQILSWPVCGLSLWSKILSFRSSI